jgi:hypothetical protein
MVAFCDDVAYDVPFWRQVTVHSDHRVSVQYALYSAARAIVVVRDLPAESCNQGIPISESGHSRCRAWFSCPGSVLQRTHDTPAELGQIHA